MPNASRNLALRTPGFGSPYFRRMKSARLRPWYRLGAPELLSVEFLLAEYSARAAEMAAVSRGLGH